MCRSIKRLRDGAEIAPDEEVRAAALQYVRKVSGFTAPSERHREAFERAVDEVAAASKELLDSLAMVLGGASRHSHHQPRLTTAEQPAS